MFHRKFKVKTSTTVKGSEKRKLKGLLEAQFPQLLGDALNSLIPNKSDMSQVKALTHNGTIVMIYYNGTNPIFFQVEDRCFPSVYTLWKFPDLLPTLTTWPIVFEKINNGADFMAPGVILEKTLIAEFQNLKENDVCAVRLLGNKSPIAVGTSITSEADLLKEGRKGKAVIIAHCYKDNLWLSGDQMPIPIIAENVFQAEEDDVEEVSIVNQNNTTIGCEATSSQNQNIDNVESSCSLLTLSDESIVDNQIEELIKKPEESLPNDYTEYNMDELIFQCFMTSVKVLGKKIQLPILSSTFYRSHVLTCCPPEINVDIKKSTYKKLSVFLQKMESEGVIKVKELSKGVESIVEINTEHDSVKSFYIHPIFKNFFKMQKAEKATEETSDQSIQEHYKFPDVVEMHVVTAQVKAIFEPSSVRKGESVTSSRVREVLRNYVKINSLQNEENARIIMLDAILTNCLLKRDENKPMMSWEELHNATISKMQPAYQLTFNDDPPILKKGALEPIDVSVAKRAGNKKVTLIHNLETFGIDPDKLAHHVQVAVAASTSVAPASNGKGMQVLIQGNQLRYLQRLFSETYKVPRKYVRGLDNLPTKKKK